MTLDIPVCRLNPSISKEVSGRCLKKVKLNVNTRLIFVSFDKIAKKLKLYTSETTFQDHLQKSHYPSMGGNFLFFYLRKVFRILTCDKNMSFDFC